MKPSVTQRLNRDLLVTVGIIALLFIAVGVILQLRWNNERYRQVCLLLDTLAARENDNLANELFERRTQALDIRLAEVSGVEDVLRVTLYDAQGHPLATASHGRPSESQAQGLAAIQTEILESGDRYRVEHDLFTITFFRPITAIGEVMGWLEIRYDLSTLRKQLIEFFLFYFTLLAITLLCMLMILRRRLNMSLVRPLQDLGVAMEALQAAEGLEHRDSPGAALQNADMEVAHLWSSFQGMAFRLNASYRELAEAGRTIQDSEKKYRDIFNNSPIGIFRTTYGGRFLEANPKLAEMFGYQSPEQLMAEVQDIAREIYPRRKDRETLIETLMKCPDGTIMEMEFKRRDGTPIYGVLHVAMQIDMESGKPSHLDGTIEDITERKKADTELRRFALVIEQATEIVVITDTSGVISYVNPAFVTVTGYTREEAIGQKPSILKSGKTPNSTYKELWQTIKSGAVWKGRFINKKKDGELFTEEASISPLRSPSGDIINFVAVKRDISRELALEVRISQAQKMEAIGALAGGIAHDFNNILSAILGYSELAMKKAGQDSKISSYMKEVFKAGLRAKDLVAQILTFSRQAERERKPLQLHIVTKEALNLLRGSIPSTVEIRQNIDTSCHAVMADNTEIHQIIMNLCTNAYQALPQTGGVIQVTLSEIDIEKVEAQTFLDLPSGKYVRLTVSDNGMGMDEKTKNRIFEPYFTTKERGEGTGLGLSTVHGIVKEMGGVIRLYSNKGEGTTFNILMPVIETTNDAVSMNLSHSESLGGSERILMVDDEEPIARLVETALAELGYYVTVQTNSIEALSLFRKNPNAFDIVVTDQMMPHMRGTELSQELVALCPDIPIIMCSGFGDVLNETESGRGVIREYIMKPVIVTELARAIRRVMDGTKQKERL